MVLSKTCVHFRNCIFKRFEWVYDQIIFFSLWLLGKRFQFAVVERVWKLFRFGRWLSFCSRKLNFGIWEGDFLSRAPRKGVSELAIFRYIVKKIEVFSEGKARKKFFCFRVCFREINIPVESWKSVEKRGNLCVRISQEKGIFEIFFSKNVWMMAIYGFLPFFSFQWLCSIIF